MRDYQHTHTSKVNRISDSVHPNPSHQHHGQSPVWSSWELENCVNKWCSWARSESGEERTNSLVTEKRHIKRTALDFISSFPLFLLDNPAEKGGPIRVSPSWRVKPFLLPSVRKSCTFTNVKLRQKRKTLGERLQQRRCFPEENVTFSMCRSLRALSSPQQTRKNPKPTGVQMDPLWSQKSWRGPDGWWSELTEPEEPGALSCSEFASAARAAWACTRQPRDKSHSQDVLSFFQQRYCVFRLTLGQEGQTQSH